MNKFLNIILNIVNRIKLFIIKTSDILWIIFMLITIVYLGYLLLFLK